jgi:LacI family transcriptional regulator
MLHAQRARAIILVGARPSDGEANLKLRRALDAYQARGGTVAMISQPMLGVSVVRVDNVSATANLARALHGLGYRRFAVLTGPRGDLTASERAQGFLGALDELGSPVPEGRRLPSDLTRDGGHAAMRELIARAPDVDLVFAIADVMALGALTAAREAGVSVPGDMGLAGFDDIATLQDVTPSLTTVRIPLRDMGRDVTGLALAPPERGPREITVAGEIVLRASTPARR